MDTQSQNDKQAVMKAVEQFYAALNTMFTGEVAPMLEVWSHADDVTYMGPDGGLRAGWEQVQPVWEFQASKKLGGKVEATEMHMTVGRDIAVTSNYEKGENIDAQGQVQKVSIRATNIFRKEDGTWKMIGHHTDILPYLEQ